MKLKNTGRSYIVLRYNTRTKGKRGELGDYKSFNVLLEPGDEASLPDNLDHISVDKVDKPTTRRGKLEAAVAKERAK